jgi:hypothetical protein
VIRIPGLQLSNFTGSWEEKMQNLYEHSIPGSEGITPKSQSKTNPIHFAVLTFVAHLESLCNTINNGTIEQIKKCLDDPLTGAWINEQNSRGIPRRVSCHQF